MAYMKHEQDPLFEKIIEILLEHVSCRHEEDSDGAGRKYLRVEYDLDEKGKEKLAEYLFSGESGETDRQELQRSLFSAFSYVWDDGHMTKAYLRISEILNKEKI